MSQDYSPSLVTKNLVFCGDAAVKSTAGPGTRLYDKAGVDSTDVKLLIHGNEGSGQNFTDSSLSNHTITAVGDATHSTTQSKFSGGSIKLDGTGDYLSVPDSSDWAFGTGDFTIDLWVYSTDLFNDAYPGLFGQYVDANNFFGLYFSNNGDDLYFWGKSGGTGFSTLQAPNQWYADRWYHVAVVKKGTTTYLFRNGVLQDTRTGQSWTYPDYAAPIKVGSWYYSGVERSFEGYMDEFRITKGVALWTQDFTPPARRDTLSISDGMMYNGTCVDFDGTDAYVTYGDVTWLDGLTTISVCCWLYQDGAPPNSGGVFVSKDNAIECWTKQSSTNQFVLSINNNHRILEGGGTPALGEWIHVVMTWNSTGDVRKLYLNGAYADVDTGGNQSGNSINNTADGLAIGARANGNYEIDGKIADTKIFSKELSAANVKELYDDSKVIIPTKNDASGGFLSQTDLTLWAPLTDGAGTIAYDGSGYGRDGTYTGTSFLSGQTGAPQLVEGYNRPMLFDGSNDYVQLASDIALASDYTIAFWILKHDVGATGWKGIISTDYTPRSLTIEWYENTGYISAYTSNDGTNWQYQVATATGITKNEWHHVAFRGTGGVGTLYLDGSLVDTGTAANPINNSTVEAPVFGRYSSGQNCACILNEVVIYNAAISAGDVQALAATDPNGGPLPADPTTLGSNGDIVGYWRNDGDVTWTDRVGSNTGTVSGSPDTLLFKQGINGSANTSTGRDGQGFPLKYKDVGAVGYKGSNYISVPHSSVFDNTAFSYCSWVYVPGDTTTDGKMAHLSRNSSGNGWAVWQLRTVNGATNQVMYQTNSGGTWQTQTYSNFFSGAGWYYVCITHAQGNAAKLYRNGIEVSGSGSCTQDFEFGTEPLYIGCRKSASSFIEFWDGQIANSQYYNRALTYAEIQQNYNSFKARFGK